MVVRPAGPAGSVGTVTTAADRWAGRLAGWAIPEHIMVAAPESPWAFSPSLFTAPADPGPDTPSRRRARAARSARPASTPLSWTDTAARAWLFGKVAQFVIFFVAIAALFFWRLFAH